MTDAPVWFVEYFDDAERRPVRVPLAHVPFRIGRRPGLDLILSSPEISTDHAEIATDGTRLLLRDLGSRNGTFLRDQPVGEGVLLNPGDVFHLGPISMRLGHTAEAAPIATASLTASQSAPAMAPVAPLASSPSVAPAPIAAPAPSPAAAPAPLSDDISSAFEAMLANSAVEPVFQPIVDLRTGQTVALEALGRGASPGLPQSPVELFRIAEASGEARELARCFRQTALAAAHWAQIRLPIFFNVHSCELEARDFFDEIASVRTRHPRIKLVLEVSEQFATPLPRLRSLRAFLNQQGIGLSYDDFGAGLARIHELAEAPSDYLKFNIESIRDQGWANDPVKRRVNALVAAARALGMRLLAKGIETTPEADACVQLGFELGQGYLYGHPAPLTSKSRG